MYDEEKEYKAICELCERKFFTHFLGKEICKECLSEEEEE